jgi:Fe-S-cluster containining protein
VNFELIQEAYAQIELQLNAIPEKNLIDFIYNATENIIEKQLKPVSQCSKQKCSFCCHNEIFVTPLEVEHIKNNTTFTLNEHNLKVQKQTFNFHKQLTFSEKACVFLKEGNCQIYEHRPLICRKHYVVEVIPEVNCKVDDNGKTTTNTEPYHPIIESFVYHLIKLQRKLEPIQNYF